MPAKIVYADILSYLDAIAKKANNPVSGAPHGVWWSGLSYTDFLSANVLGQNVIDTTTPLQSAFYVILTNPSGSQGISQMPGAESPPPAAGPFITDANYTATLADGTTISGAQIQQNIESWLNNGYPET
jgi:hypothetical protein